jgi:L-aminopeptidase/D-esterase-like protein
MIINRREFTGIASSLPLMSRGSFTTSDESGGLTDVSGLKVGHFTDSRRPTGCTVIICEAGAVAGVDVRGSAPGTRETDLLDPVNTVHKVHAVMLSGGSAFGLDAASGAVQYLEEKGIGYQTSVAKVPIVPAAILFDLGVGDSSIRPDKKSGYQACTNATDDKIEEGNVGAGAGATVGKILGMDHAMKGGLGTASIQVEGLVVAALVAVNCVGDVTHPWDGTILAGARNQEKNAFANTTAVLKTKLRAGRARKSENTTLAVVATNAAFGKSEMTKIAQMSHDGFARAIRPVHLPFDGDTIFSLSTGSFEGGDLAQVGSLAAEVTSAAIVRAILAAESLPNLPAHGDFVKQMNSKS